MSTRSILTVLFLIFLPPVGIVLALTHKQWSRQKKLTAIIISLLWVGFWFIGSTDSVPKAKKAPAIVITNSVVNDDKTYIDLNKEVLLSDKYSLSVSTGTSSEQKNTTLTVNDVNVPPSIVDASRFYFEIDTTNLSESYKIIASNDKGTDEKTIYFIKKQEKPLSDYSKPEAKELPTFEVEDSSEENEHLTISTSLKNYDIRFKTSNIYSSSGHSLKVNGTAVNIGILSTKYKTDLNPGENVFTIIAENNIGVVTKKLIVNYIPGMGSSDDAIFEAEVSCVAYAQSYFNVKDINVGYDQSSIERVQSDGTILIKVNIADSRGFLRAEKAIGVMECTTSADGLRVIKFISY